MNRNWTCKAIVLGVTAMALLVSSTGCCGRCCSPSIEVGLYDPNKPCHPDHPWRYYDNLRILTWKSLADFPDHLDPTTADVTGSKLKVLWPHLARVLVTNYSDVDVRGVTVVFYWARWGLFDNGTPLGAAALDIPANSSRWVRSPSFLAGLPGGPSEVHRCLFAQVFHPCDTELLNNCGYNNFVVVAVLRSWNIHHLPFTAHFANKDGPLTLAFEAPDGVNVHVVRGRLPEGPADAFEERETIQRLFVKRGVPQELSLVVENAGADFGPGDTFDVTVKALHNQREVSSFTVRFQVGEQGG